MRTAISKRIKDIRRDLGPWPGKLLPRQLVADALGVDLGTVKRWEGGTVPEPENLEKLARLAGCDVDWILTGHGRPPQRGASVPRMPQDARSPRTPRQMAPSVLAAQTAQSEHPGNTPAMGGEETHGSPGSDKAVVDMALSVLQRALWAAVEHDQQDHQGNGREAVYRTLKSFANEMFALGLFQVAMEVAQMADRFREGGFIG